MNKLKMIALATMLTTGIASAAPSCDGFQIRLKNNLADDLLVTSIKLNGADIQPGGFEKLNSKSEQVFTINRSEQGTPMTGKFTFHTLSLPSKTVEILYILENKGPVCKHTHQSSTGDYAVEKTRKIGEVQYSINNQ